MKKAKYIIFDYMNLEVPVVFSPILNHADVAGGKAVISAGFCKSEIQTGCLSAGIDEKIKYQCFGESESLKIKSRPGDADILNKYLEYDC